MDTGSIIKKVVSEYVGDSERSNFRSFELHGNNRRISVCTYQSKPLYVVEKKIWTGRIEADELDVYKYKEEMAVRSQEGAAFMLWETFNKVELRVTATQESIRTHDLVCLNLRGKQCPSSNINMEEFISFVQRYLDIIASSI
jgi:hypothetical protein|mmetsp:Transcript_4681/g.4822  ORF Transcript_4681/g.4822 Transcript_4681/m.4822 type:complete len:142 (+) Transcript_4681:415-840(+)